MHTIIHSFSPHSYDAHTGLSSSSSFASNKHRGINQNLAEQQLSRGNQKLSSDDDLELPKKQVKPSPKDQQVEDVECEPASCQGIKDTKLTLSQKAGILCSSTLEKLKGFTCGAEPSVVSRST